MKKYFIHYPRNFANEFTVYSVKPEEERQAEEFIEKANNDPDRSAYWLTRREVKRKVGTLENIVSFSFLLDL